MSHKKPVHLHPKRLEKLNFWRNHIERYQQSPLTCKEYCKENGLIPHRFFYWRKKINKLEKTLEDSDTNGIVELSPRDFPLPINSHPLIRNNGEYTMKIFYRNVHVELNNHFSVSALQELLG